MIQIFHMGCFCPLVLCITYLGMQSWMEFRVLMYRLGGNLTSYPYHPKKIRIAIFSGKMRFYQANYVNFQSFFIFPLFCFAFSFASSLYFSFSLFLRFFNLFFCISLSPSFLYVVLCFSMSLSPPLYMSFYFFQCFLLRCAHSFSGPYFNVI